jgi:hypothetical protein
VSQLGAPPFIFIDVSRGSRLANEVHSSGTDLEVQWGGAAWKK